MEPIVSSGIHAWPHVYNNNKYFYKYINSKRKARENLHPLLDAKGNLVTKDQDKAEVLNAFVASLFHSKTHYFQRTQSPVLVDRNGDPNRPCIIHNEMVLDLLQKLDARVQGARLTGTAGRKQGLLCTYTDRHVDTLSLLFCLHISGGLGVLSSHRNSATAAFSSLWHLDPSMCSAPCF